MQKNFTVADNFYIMKKGIDYDGYNQVHFSSFG